MSTCVSVLTASTIDSLSTEPDILARITSEIDNLGMSSGIDQNLKGPITTIDKLKDSDHLLFIYKVTDGFDESIKGYLKIGYKNLFFYTPQGKVVEMADVPVCLDFYIHEKHQRKGIGKILFDSMLEAVSKEACDFAYDRPSHKLTPFLRKNYNLTHQDLQPNRYAIYPREGFPLFEN